MRMIWYIGGYMTICWYWCVSPPPQYFYHSGAPSSLSHPHSCSSLSPSFPGSGRLCHGGCGAGSWGLTHMTLWLKCIDEALFNATSQCIRVAIFFITAHQILKYNFWMDRPFVVIFTQVTCHSHFCLCFWHQPHAACPFYLRALSLKEFLQVSHAPPLPSCSSMETLHVSLIKKTAVVEK